MQKRFKIINLILLFSIFNIDYSLAQDSTTKKDSTKIYQSIEEYSKRSKFTDFIYHLLFKPVKNDLSKNKSKKKIFKNITHQQYVNFEGKIIRHINIETLDPFGYSVTDTSLSTENSLLKAANKVHVKTKKITIRNLLLFRQDDIFDSLKVKESERLIRSRKFVHDVLFYAKLVSKNSDSVDVYIRELDNWSLIPGFYVSPSHFTFHLTERNFIGTGHESENHLSWFFNTGASAYNINYSIPNIKNTYINTTLHTDKDEFNNYKKSFSVDRPFFSPFAKWAAGVYFAQQSLSDSIHLEDPLFLPHKLKFNTQDYWVGNSIQIFSGNTEENRTTNFISTLRLMRTHYVIKPVEIYDLSHNYSDENFYLAGIGISQRKFEQEKYIFDFGITEDVPLGKVYSVTGGYLTKNNSGMIYAGAKISSGNYFPWEYLSASYEYGTFFRSSHAEQGIFTTNVTYFTNAWEPGKWKFRQFVRPEITIGLNRKISDSLTIKDGYGLDGFNSIGLSGVDRFLLKLQTQTYSPWNLIGFRFGPFFTYTFGMLGDNEIGFRHSRVYSQIGVGILIKNDNLVLNTFQISISFYPLIPGNGQDIFKANTFKTTDFQLKSFEIGKPTTIAYQ